jgi:hypothetical protein
VAWHALYRQLLAIRRARIVPLIPHVVAGEAHFTATEDTLDVRWPLDDRRALRLCLRLHGALQPNAEGDVLWQSGDAEGWPVRWTVERGDA